MVITCNKKIVLKNILNVLSFKRLKNTLACILIKKIYLNVDSLIDISNIITGSNNTT